MALSSTLPAASAKVFETVGFEKTLVHSKERDENLTVLIWYPALPGGDLEAVGENRVFAGTKAFQNAPVAKGMHPLVLLSHGSGASVERMAWIAVELAANGFVVAGPNHPGTTSGDSTPEDTPKLWQRTNDLSTLLDHLLQDPVWRAAIDPERVGSLGFSLGGAAVLRSVGALATVEAYVRYCDTYPGMADCRWFKGGRAYRHGEEIKVRPFDLRSVNRARFEQREQDLRIRAVVAVDPALAAVFDPASLEPVNIPLHFINLGLPKTIPIAVKSDELAEGASSGSLDYVANAVHFSFLPECAPGAADFLKRIGETDELCADGGARPRAELHQELADKIVTVLQNSLSVGK
ncbi:dienelactone hydrolase [Labrenzia sp. VG12]|uniref:alpha/beta hydrolase family protein n=1 Tax=Labrenzia sp. VG12 TaxID=2021862 RepID=UPI0018DEF3B9|nr:dienelactone hydrolase [Labrenzia sp. VG12]